MPVSQTKKTINNVTNVHAPSLGALASFFQTKKPSEPLTLIWALIPWTLFMIFFWWPTRVMPSSVRSFTVMFTTPSIELTPPAWKFSKYLVIFIEFSHSSTDAKLVKSGASAANGWGHLKGTYDILDAKRSHAIFSNYFCQNLPLNCSFRQHKNVKYKQKFIIKFIMISKVCLTWSNNGFVF